MNDKRNTSKKERFVRLANARVNKTLKQLDLVGNLSNKAVYAYTEDEANQIIKVLNKKVKDVETRFKGSINKSQFKI